MAGEARVLDLLETVQARQRDAGHGWAADAVLMAVKRRVLNLADRGLLELADRDERAALSAWEGRPVRWAARLAPPGHDLLLYRRARPPQAAPEAPGTESGRQRVELCLSQMAALLLAVSLAGRLQQPLTDGIADQVRAARCDHLVKRWVLHLTPDQVDCVAYVFWLHKMTGSASEANRFTRDTGITYQPTPAPRTAIPPCVPILHRRQTPAAPPGRRG